MTTPETPTAPGQPTTSDIPAPSNEWLEEPTLPKKEDFKNPENFEFAFNEYKHKLELYQARIRLHKACEKIEEEKAKDVFKCFQDKQYPNYDDFNPYDPEEKALGYGRAAKRLGFKVALVAQWIKEHEKFKTDITTGILYFYNGKTWIASAEPYLEHLVNLILGKDTKKTHYNNIEFSLKALTYEQIEFSQKLACENGLLDLGTLTLTPFNEKEMVFHKIPVTYNKGVDKNKLNNWLEFLKQVANPEDIPLLQEWFGYCFLPDFPKHKALWIHGPGRNGKGVFDRTIKGLLGPENFSTVGLESLDGTQRFVLKNLYGKLYNASSEPISNKIFQTEIFQKITGGDAIDAEFKGANNEKRFTSYAKVTILGNKFPRIRNPTPAFKMRMLFVKFSNTFDDNSQIEKLENVWLNDPEQRSAIFNWAMEGLQRLMGSHYNFSVTKTQLETEIEFNRVISPPTAFIMEIGIIQKNLTTTRAEVLTAFQEYGEEKGLNVDAKLLTKALEELSPKVRPGWIYKPKKERTWVGFGLKNQEQQSIEQMEQLEQQSNLLQNFNESKNIKQLENSVPSVLSEQAPVSENQLKVVTEESGLRHIETGKPIWFVKDIPQGAKCECGALNVTKELVTPQKEIIKRCTECYEKLKQSFPNAIWKPAYPEMPTYDVEGP